MCPGLKPSNDSVYIQYIACIHIVKTVIIRLCTEYRGFQILCLFYFFFALANNLKCMSKAFKDFSESKIKAYLASFQASSQHILHHTLDIVRISGTQSSAPLEMFLSALRVLHNMLHFRCCLVGCQRWNAHKPSVKMTLGPNRSKHTSTSARQAHTTMFHYGWSVNSQSHSLIESIWFIIMSLSKTVGSQKWLIGFRLIAWETIKEM